jgi:hypothetical protein
MLPSHDARPSNTDLLSRHDAAKYAGVSAVTLWRWMTKGIRDSFGNRVRLRRQRRGGVLYTTGAWIDEFFSELDRADDARWAPSSQPSRPESLREQRGRRERDIDAAAVRVQARVTTRRSA